MPRDIVERLRNKHADDMTAWEAAYEIERLRDERDRLKNELLECQDILDEYRRSEADKCRWGNAND